MYQLILQVTDSAPGVLLTPTFWDHVSLLVRHKAISSGSLATQPKLHATRQAISTKPSDKEKIALWV